MKKRDDFSTRNIREMLVANPDLTDEWLNRVAQNAGKTYQSRTLLMQRRRADKMREEGREHEATLRAEK